MTHIQLPFEPWSPPVPEYRDRANTFAIYPSTNDLGIPDLLGTTWVPDRLVAHRDPRRYGPDAALHFFIDDYRFEPVWQNPAKYLEQFGAMGAVCTPDFSVYPDWPIAVQVWQTYRNRWVGAYMESFGVRVIPTVGWATPADFFYAGLPRHSVLAVATTGVRRTADGIEHFRAGFERLANLEPTTVLVYGGLDGIMDDPPFPVVEYPAFLDERRSVMEASRWADDQEAPSGRVPGRSSRAAAVARPPEDDSSDGTPTPSAEVLGPWVQPPASRP